MKVVVIGGGPAGMLAAISAARCGNEVSILEKINSEYGTTIIMATHDRETVNRMKRRVLLLENGVLASDDKEGSYKAHESN